MRRKMTDNFITALGFISVVNIIYDIIININNSEKSGLVIVSIILLTIIIGYFYFSKNQRIDLYGTLFTMAKNNKLHAIREMIFIIYKSICGNSNRYVMEYVNFTYTFFQPGEYKDETCISVNKIDVKYELDFEINLGRSNRILANNRDFKFYIIGNLQGRQCEEAKYWIQYNSELIEKPLNLKSVTISKTDRIQQVASLYEGTVRISENWIKQRSGNLKIKVEYIVPEDIDINDKGKQYNFFICPQNYASTIKNCKIQIKTNNVMEIYDVVLQIICSDLNNNENAIEVVQDLNDQTGNGEYLLDEETFTPDMKAVYFVDFKWGKDGP